MASKETPPATTRRRPTKKTAALAAVPDPQEEKLLDSTPESPETPPPATPDDAQLEGVLTSVELTVGMVPLMAALQAVVAHAEKAKLGDEELRLSRVRVIATPPAIGDQRGPGQLYVVATNLGNANARGAVASAAYARVPVDHDSRTDLFPPAEGPFLVDVHPAKVRDLVAGLKPKRVDGGKEGMARVIMRAPGAADQPGSISVTDVSGLWPGQVTKRPTLPLLPDFPDVMAQIGRALAGASGVYKPLVASTSRFEAAMRAYEEELMVAPTGNAESRGFAVMCGDQFAGFLESRHNDFDNRRRYDAFLRAHLDRVGPPAKSKAV